MWDRDPLSIADLWPHHHPTGEKEEGGGCGCQTPSRSSETTEAASAAAAGAPSTSAPGQDAAAGITNDMVLIEGASE